MNTEKLGLRLESLPYERNTSTKKMKQLLDSITCVKLLDMGCIDFENSKKRRVFEKVIKSFDKDANISVRFNLRDKYVKLFKGIEYESTVYCSFKSYKAHKKSKFDTESNENVYIYLNSIKNIDFENLLSNSVAGITLGYVGYSQAVNDFINKAATSGMRVNVMFPITAQDISQYSDMQIENNAVVELLEQYAGNQNIDFVICDYDIIKLIN